MGDYIFGLDPQLLVDSAITILAMFFVFLLLSYLLFNPARNLMEKRQEGIREQMETAAREKQDAIQFKAEYDEKIKNVQKETDEILSEARKKALKKESVMLEEAREEAAQIVARANREVELEKSKVKDEMKQEIINVATAMAGKIVASSLDESKQSQLLADTLEEMGDETWLS
ncbi:MAG: ATP synthase F0 subunit B [Clostridium sp. 42_12]|nr:MAG: ATP synthase F0 subunit B [Clostridium sp. 42_12]